MNDIGSVNVSKIATFFINSNLKYPQKFINLCKQMCTFYYDFPKRHPRAVCKNMRKKLATFLSVYEFVFWCSVYSKILC